MRIHESAIKKRTLRRKKGLEAIVGRVHQKEHRGLLLRHEQAEGLPTKTILRARRLLSLSRAFLRNRYPNTSDAPFVPPRACGAVPCAFRNPYSTDRSIPPDWIRRARCTPASRRWRCSAGIPQLVHIGLMIVQDREIPHPRLGNVAVVEEIEPFVQTIAIIPSAYGA